jgi:hypothetical protein
MLTDAGNVVHNLCDPVGCSIFQPVKLKWMLKQIMAAKNYSLSKHLKEL